MAEAIVSFAVERLGDLLIQEASFLYEATDKVVEIQAELRRMKCFLKDADARRNEDEVIRNWVAEIREAAYDAEDVVDTFAFKVALRRRSGLRNQLRRYACIFSEFKALHEVGTEIDAIKTRISSLTASLQSYNIRSIAEGQSSSSSSRNDRRQQLLRRTYSHLDDEDTVGVEDSVKILVKELVKPDQRCSVVSIWGMGGLGKTTLARKVYRDVDVRRHFDHFAWSSISQQFNIRDVVVGILINLTSADKQQRTEIEKLRDDEIFKKVYEIQEQRKCLVILDDVWKVQDLESLKPSFPLHKVAAGSKILLTTRNNAVASHFDPGWFVYRPKFLSEEESWELLRRKAFTRGHHGPDPTNNNIELWGREMAKYCGGLPLAVVVLGGLLATKNTFDEWDRVHRNIKSYLRRGKNNFEEEQGSGGVLDVLKLSYQDLPYQLKSCFLYLGHFPEDYDIPTKRLVRMWVAEGIISRVGEEALEDVAEGYLDELIGRCMVQEGERSSNGRVKTCRLHDLIRDVCLSKAKEENFLEIINLQESETFPSSMVTTTIPNNVRRCAIYLNGYVAEGRVVSKNSDEDANCYVNLNPKKGAHLRSLLMLYPPNIWLSLMGGKLGLNNFKLLRVLSLERLPLEEKNLEGIGNLIHLKYLSFRYATLSTFPSSIRNLGCIQMLDLRFHGSGYKLASFKIRDVICGMKWLKHLYLPPHLGMDNSKVQWDKLSNLESLANFNAIQWDVKDLASLTRIRKLRITEVESFKELEVILKPSCPISSNLRSLELPHVRTKVEETDLRLLSDCQHLCKLALEGEISNLPRHHHFPPNLTKLTLEGAHLEQDPIPILERLLNLTILHLWSDFYTGEEMVFSTNGFPQLKYLWLSHCFSLRRLLVEKSAMPSLKHLRIRKCTSLEMVPEGLRYISTLQNLDMEYMPKEFIQRLQVIDGKEGEDFYKVRHVPFISLIAEDGDTDEDTD